MRAYSQDLRERIVRGREAGEGVAELAKRYKVAVRTVYKYWQRYRDHSELQGRQHGGHKRSYLEAHDQELRQWIGEKNDITLAELQRRFWQDIQLCIGTSSIWRRIEKLGLSLKKKHSGRRTGSTRR